MDFEEPRWEQGGDLQEHAADVVAPELVGRAGLS